MTSANGLSKLPASRSAVKSEVYETVATVVGPAFEMPEASALEGAMSELPPPDFQARQDAISLIRRSPAGKLAPKLRSTSVQPAKAKETKLNL